jgi:hypothetical protein
MLPSADTSKLGSANSAKQDYVEISTDLYQLKTRTRRKMMAKEERSQQERTLESNAKSWGRTDQARERARDTRFLGERSGNHCTTLTCGSWVGERGHFISPYKGQLSERT